MHACTCSTCSSSSYATPFGKTNKKKKGLSALKFFFKKSNFVWIYHQKKILAVERNFSSCLCAGFASMQSLAAAASFLPRQHVVPPIVLLFYLKLPPFPPNPPTTLHKPITKSS
jgi:hypothetical protein